MQRPASIQSWLRLPLLLLISFVSPFVVMKVADASSAAHSFKTATAGGDSDGVSVVGGFENFDGGCYGEEASDGPVGWWPGALDALRYVDRLMPCATGIAAAGGDGDDDGPSFGAGATEPEPHPRVCPTGDVTDARGRVVGRHSDGAMCRGPPQVQRWLTTRVVATDDAKGGAAAKHADETRTRVVPAIQRWFEDGEECGGGGGTKERMAARRRVLFFCGGESSSPVDEDADVDGGSPKPQQPPVIAWEGGEDEARSWATGAPWIVQSHAAKAAARRANPALLECEGEVHVAVPELCRYLPGPEWLDRYERIVRDLSLSRPGARKGYHDNEGLGIDGDERWGDKNGEGGAKVDLVAEEGKEGSEDGGTVAEYNLTYGELSTEGGLALVDALFNEEEESPSPQREHPEEGGRRGGAVVYDLGSGFGLVTVLFAVAGGGDAAVQKSVGIELDPSRHLYSVRMLRRAAEFGLLTDDEAGRIEFRVGDAFAPGAFADATHVYTLSTCFGPWVFARLVNSISPGETPRLRWVVSSRKIPQRLIRLHNDGLVVDCHDEQCTNVTTTTMRTVARAAAPAAADGAAAASHPVGDGGYVVPVARLRLANTLDVPTTFALHFHLHLYRVEVVDQYVRHPSVSEA